MYDGQPAFKKKKKNKEEGQRDSEQKQILQKSFIHTESKLSAAMCERGKVSPERLKEKVMSVRSENLSSSSLLQCSVSATAASSESRNRRRRRSTAAHTVDANVKS